MARSKYISVAERLSNRIQCGGYNIHGIPGEEHLAEEFDVSYMTLRKAVQELINKDIVLRLPNGRLKVNNKKWSEKGGIQKQIAFLTPEWNSPEYRDFQNPLSQLSVSSDFILRLVQYHHWDDPVIYNTISRFDCTFMIPNPEMTEAVASKIKGIGKPIFILSDDWSSYGIPSIMQNNSLYVQKMMDHLASLGHMRIDCLNVQPEFKAISERIAQWRAWLNLHGLGGKLYNEPIQLYEHAAPAAYNLVEGMIRKGKFDCKAIVCTTTPVAVGTIRAMLDHGIRPGTDAAVCSVDYSDIHEYSTPSLTSVSKSDFLPHLASCISWLQGGEKKWEGSMLLQPSDMNAVVRESTVPDIDKVQIPERMRYSLNASKAAGLPICV
ncbi:MAG TPA: hypothetical protein DCZ94_22440 [Lentisphaeria bacterium]|nr:MAG: hypothetical protein A2X48_13680 [Lentisphaerae bacterium GWF2_49_21]HBC89708.1 hypothetical protein [Lentisphaeria bacterium]